MINKFWDKIGICASGLCLVHCLATPALLIFFPTSFLGSISIETAHQVFAVVVIISLLLAVYPTCKQHKHKDILAIASVGILSILSAVFLHEFMSENFAHGLTVFGSVFLIWAHIKNMKVRHGKCSSH